MITSSIVQFSAVHSLVVSDDRDALSLYLTMSDGSTCAIDLPLDALIRQAHTIEPATHRPTCAVLH